jgi:hypothetical protein
LNTGENKLSAERKIPATKLGLLFQDPKKGYLSTREIQIHHNLWLIRSELNVATEWVPLLRVREASGSDLGPETHYPWISRGFLSIQENVGIIPQIRHRQISS